MMKSVTFVGPAFGAGILFSAGLGTVFPVIVLVNPVSPVEEELRKPNPVTGSDGEECTSFGFGIPAGPAEADVEAD